jgi:hypothetical protein
MKLSPGLVGRHVETASGEAGGEWRKISDRWPSVVKLPVEISNMRLARVKSQIAKPESRHAQIDTRPSRLEDTFQRFAWETACRAHLISVEVPATTSPGRAG